MTSCFQRALRVASLLLVLPVLPVLAGAQAKPAKSPPSTQAAAPAGTASASRMRNGAKTADSATKVAATVSATCNDGSKYAGSSRKGACSSHGGVKEWAPTIVRATCTDGTAYEGTSRRGACAKHGGVKEWAK